MGKQFARGSAVSSCTAATVALSVLFATVAYKPAASLADSHFAGSMSPPAGFETNEDMEQMQSPQSALKAMWGTAVWPPTGLAYIPPRSQKSSANTNAAWSTLFEVALLLAAGAFCCGLALHVCGVSLKANDLAAGVLAADPDTGPSSSPVHAGGHSVPDAAVSHKMTHQEIGEAAKFTMHLRALTFSIIWKNLHRHAVFLHILRIAVPVIFLVLIHHTRSWLTTEFSKNEWMPAMTTMGGGTPEGFMDAVTEYVLTVTMLYIVMMSMVFFVWHIAAESESGFRYLLHVSGLSRSAYTVATVGVDGVLQALSGLGVMLLVSAVGLRVRMVLWSSTFLLISMTALLAVSSALLGHLLHFLFRSARVLSFLAQITVLIVILSAPIAVLSPVIPGVHEQSWRTLAFPVIPAYRGLFELVSGCARGRCLMLSDLTDALSSGKWVPPWYMVWGASHAKDPSPPEALICFLGLLVVQLGICVAIAVFLDRHRHPALHASGAQGARASTAQGTVLDVRGLVHRYGLLHGFGLSKNENVLSGVSFAVAKGGMLGLLGPNGAGKTTVIRCITGEEQPCEGSVAISSCGGVGTNGVYVGLCPQETILNGDLTVSENLLFFAFVRGAQGLEAKGFVKHLLKATRLEEKRDSLPNTLSGGMRRRLAVACAMVAMPSVAILDEPTTGLDPVSRRGIWTTIQEVKAVGGCCLLTTHMLEEAEALCSNIVVMQRGVVAAEGSVQQLKEHWGTGYMLNVDSKLGQEHRCREYVGSLLDDTDCEPIKTTAHGQMTFKVSSDEEALGHLIIAIARGKEASGIRHWGISQASLEDTYLRIVQQDSDSV